MQTKYFGTNLSNDGLYVAMHEVNTECPFKMYIQAKSL